jgi:histidyl-tRNA synthetase
MTDLQKKLKVTNCTITQDTNISNIMFKTAQGTRDYYGDDFNKMKFLKESVEAVFKQFQCVPMNTPTFERRDLLMKKYGEEEKLIFDIKEKPTKHNEYATNDDLEKETWSLRYDQTIPLVRYVISNGIEKMARYSIGEVYRMETMSKKQMRLRQFTQADVDFVGIFDRNLSEIKIFKMINLFFKRIGIEKYTIKYNYRDLLAYYVKSAGIADEKFKEVCASIDKLGKTCEQYVRNELLERGLTDNNITRLFALLNQGDFPEGDNVTEINTELEELIQDYCVTNVKFDPTLARGLDYYSGIIFEVTLEGFESSVGGGGRYDNLVNSYREDLNIPMIGFSFGLDRLMDFIKTPRINLPTIVVFTIVQGTSEDNRRQLNKFKAKVIDMVIECGYAVDYLFNDRKARKQLSKIAADPNYKYAIIIGMSELETNSVSLKNLATRSQTIVSLDQIRDNISF